MPRITYRKEATQMTYTDQQKQEALHLLELCGTQERWDALRNMAECLFRKPTKEEQERDTAFKRKQEEEETQRREAKKAQEEGFEAWKRKRIGSFRIPVERYDIGTNDLDVLVPFLDFYGLQTARALDAVCSVYDYGFKRGQNYQKNSEKKKAVPHAANMKNGLDCSTSEI